MPAHIHGADGLGGAPRPVSTTTIAGADAVGFLAATFRQAADAGEQVDLLMIGPLTNLALVLQRDPGLVRGIGRLTIMGGTVYGRGNSTPAAEFNIFADPEAAAIVFGADIETVVVPWEPCVTHYLSGAEVDALFEPIPDGPRESVFASAGQAMRARSSPAMAMATISASSTRSRPQSSSNPAS